MKTHLNFATRDLSKSVAFYRTLLQVEPVKQRSDYALFITEDPGLELALDLNERFGASHGAHFGIVVPATGEVDSAIARFSAAGVETLIEREETCCYAKQTKAWVSDPDGRRWEVYTVVEETQERDNSETPCCANDANRSCCAS